MQIHGAAHLSALQHWSKEDLAYHELRAAILAGVLGPGERLLPNELADRFNVSTMPVRQALTRLERDRLVLRNPNRGLTVAPLSIKEVEEIYSLRVVLEGLATRLATDSLSDADLESLAAMVHESEMLVASGDREALAEINRRFHFVIYRAADNELLYDTLDNLWDLSTRYRPLYYADSGVPEQTLQEHRNILAALQHREATRAEELVRSDMEETARVLLALIRSGIEASEESVNGKLPLV
ncbi:MAG: GntR family transcriptional regulator [Chloroflexota bacterium]